MSKELGIAHTSIKNNLLLLEEQKLVLRFFESKGQRKFPIYKANRDSRQFLWSKRVFNIASLFESGLIDFLEEKLMPKVIVLFGSYQRGEDTEESDIDLFLECKKEEIDLKKFEKILQRKIELHFNEHFLTYPKELKNNIINGIVVFGYLEGYK